MRRRELLKSLAGVPFIRQLVISGETKSAIAPIPPGNYMLFVDPRAVDVTKLLELPLPAPDITMEVVPVYPHGEQTIEDVVKIYRVDKEAGDAANQGQG